MLSHLHDPPDKISPATWDALFTLTGAARREALSMQGRAAECRTQSEDLRLSFLEGAAHRAGMQRQRRETTPMRVRAVQPATLLPAGTCVHETTPATLFAIANLTGDEVWIEYYARGGARGPDDLAAYLAGWTTWPARERQILAHTFNEHFIDEGISPLASYVY